MEQFGSMLRYLSKNSSAPALAIRCLWARLAALPESRLSATSCSTAAANRRAHAPVGRSSRPGVLGRRHKLMWYPPPGLAASSRPACSLSHPELPQWLPRAAWSPAEAFPGGLTWFPGRLVGTGSRFPSGARPVLMPPSLSGCLPEFRSRPRTSGGKVVDSPQPGSRHHWCMPAMERSPDRRPARVCHTFARHLAGRI